MTLSPHGSRTTALRPILMAFLLLLTVPMAAWDAATTAGAAAGAPPAEGLAACTGPARELSRTTQDLNGSPTREALTRAVGVTPDGSILWGVFRVVADTSNGYYHLEVRGVHTVNGTVAWSLTYGGGGFGDFVPAASPSGDRLYVAAEHAGTLLAIDLTDGSLLWEVPLDLPSSHSKVYALKVSPDGRRVALGGAARLSSSSSSYPEAWMHDTHDGLKLWTHREDITGSVRSLTFTADGNTLVAGGSSHVSGDMRALLMALDAGNGSKTWSTRVTYGGDGYAPRVARDLALSLDGGMVLMASAPRSDVHAFNLSDGSLAWAAFRPGVQVYWAEVRLHVDGSTGDVHLTGEARHWSDGSGWHYQSVAGRVDPAAGAYVWSREWAEATPGLFAAYHPVEGGLLILSGGNTTAVDAATGDFRWRWHGTTDAVTIAPDGGEVFSIRTPADSTAITRVFRTPAAVPPCLTPHRGVGEISVTWGHPDGTELPRSYRVYVGPDADHLEHAADVAADEPLVHTMSGLAEGETVTVGVTEVRDGVESPLRIATVAAAVRPGTTTVGPLPGFPLEGHATVEWSLSISNGGAPLTGWKVYAALEGETPTHRMTLNPTSSWARIGTFDDGVNVTVQVAAVNGVGEGALSEPIVVRTPAAPSEPLNFSVEPGTGFGEVHVSWSPPSDDSGYSVRYIVHRTNHGGYSRQVYSGYDLSFVDAPPDPVLGSYAYGVKSSTLIGSSAYTEPQCTTPYPWDLPFGECGVMADVCAPTPRLPGDTIHGIRCGSSFSSN